jgi:hypothetical protein
MVRTRVVLQEVWREIGLNSSPKATSLYGTTYPAKPDYCTILGTGDFC